MSKVMNNYIELTFRKQTLEQALKNYKEQSDLKGMKFLMDMLDDELETKMIFAVKLIEDWIKEIESELKSIEADYTYEILAKFENESIENITSALEFYKENYKGE